jgi:putative membrane protein
MLATVTTWIVIVLHVAFALGESVGWSQMSRRFGYSREATETTRTLALNQGAYNAGLAGMLAWALITGQASTVVALLIYVIAMAVVGALSVRWTLFVFQGIPATIALAATLLARS